MLGIPSPCGIFLLLKAGEIPPQELLKDPFVEGISVRVRWRDVEPEPGRYDWSYLDSIFDLSERYDKKVMLRILAGYWSPQWLYESGIPILKAYFRGQEVRFPAVWDERYMYYFSRLVREVGKRYGNHPRLILVHMSGPTIFSAEPILARNSKELKTIESHGFSPYSILERWKETARLFKETFPNRVLSLNIHYVIDADTTLLSKLLKEIEEIIPLGYLSIQGNWLGVDFVEQHPDLFHMVLKHKESGGIVGFQTIAPLLKRARSRGMDRKRAREYVESTLQLAKRVQANYLEVYPSDVGYLRGRFDRPKCPAP